MHRSYLVMLSRFSTNPNGGYHKEWPRSVLMAECLVAQLFNYYCGSAIIPCKGILLSVIVAYVDDLNFLVSDPLVLIRVVRLIREYTDDMALALSDEKTILWGSDEKSLKTVCGDLRFRLKNTLHAMPSEQLCKTLTC